MLRNLIEGGQLTPAIEQRFELGQIADAMRAMDGHAAGEDRPDGVGRLLTRIARCVDGVA